MSNAQQDPFEFTDQLKHLIQESAEILIHANNIIVFTGAGISAESGIATFRAPDVGVWTNKLGLVLFGTPFGWWLMPKISWKVYIKYFRNPIVAAYPNDGHYAIAKLEQLHLYGVVDDVSGLMIENEVKDEKENEIIIVDDVKIGSDEKEKENNRDNDNDDKDNGGEIIGLGINDQENDDDDEKIVIEEEIGNNNNNENVIDDNDDKKKKKKKEKKKQPKKKKKKSKKKIIDNHKFSIITQNVDGLHQRAGSNSENIAEVHGTIWRHKCSKNKHIHPYKLDPCKFEDEYIPSEDPFFDLDNDYPQCPECSSHLRPDAILFTEGLPEDYNIGYQKVKKLSPLNGDVMIVVGCSGVVYPAAGLPEMAKEYGITIIEVNPDKSNFTDFVDYFLQGPSGEILPALVKEYEKLLNDK
eukprot:TRINITY_DN2243_c0_g5_i2.p1 TRINITY_DN2243_c0_g5~~TRINITY_DN2243_c0_g5_i2.p1  ORF type:complete len:412 (+),score=146.10 TRINITY_DN2243_c0_g5_i2:54-1289(+)